MSSDQTTFDLLVLGGGMAGLSAAAWSVRQGRSVLLVEKGELGGSALNAGFIWTAPSLEVLREAIPDGDPRLAERLIEDFEPAVEWVRSLDVECQPAVTVLRFGRGHQTSLLNYLRACELIVRDDPRSEIVLGGTAKRLLVEDGEVRGRRSAPVVRGDANRARGRDGRSPPAGSRAIPSCARRSSIRRRATSRCAGTGTARATGCGWARRRAPRSAPTTPASTGT